MRGVRAMTAFFVRKLVLGQGLSGLTKVLRWCVAMGFRLKFLRSEDRSNVRSGRKVSARVTEVGPFRDRRLKVWSPDPHNSMYPYVALRDPTYLENSHTTHTWHTPSHQIARFEARKKCPCGFDSHRALHFQPTLANTSHLIASLHPAGRW